MDNSDIEWSLQTYRWYAAYRYRSDRVKTPSTNLAAESFCGILFRNTHRAFRNETVGRVRSEHGVIAIKKHLLTVNCFSVYDFRKPEAAAVDDVNKQYYYTDTI